jgi:hypothetical protein
MALSENVDTALKDAESALRTALFYASRNERSSVNLYIAELLSAIGKISKYETLTDQIEDITKKNGSNGINFFGGM